MKKLSARQQSILAYLKTVETATLDEIVKNVPIYYYANSKFHIGNILRRLVKSNIITRIKKDVYSFEISNIKTIQTSNTTQTPYTNQTSLFNL